MHLEQLINVMKARVIPALALSIALSAMSAAVRASEVPYQINPGDILGISVWKEQELQSEAVVRPDGGISFPLVGDIDAAGNTVEGLRQLIADRLERYIPDPVVTVAVRELSGSRIYVIGKVNRPGVFQMNQELDVMQALALAGGLTAYAASNDIKVLRRSDRGQQVFEFQYSEVADGENLQQNRILQSGDTVVVP